MHHKISLSPFPVRQTGHADHLLVRMCLFFFYHCLFFFCLACSYYFVCSCCFCLACSFALLVFFYPCFTRVGDLMNNIHVRGWALDLCVYCVDSRRFTWVVRFGAPQKIFKPHPQISRLGMWTICFHIPKDYIFLEQFF